MTEQLAKDILDENISIEFNSDCFESSRWEKPLADLQALARDYLALREGVGSNRESSPVYDTAHEVTGRTWTELQNRYDALRTAAKEMLHRFDLNEDEYDSGFNLAQYKLREALNETTQTTEAA